MATETRQLVDMLLDELGEQELVVAREFLAFLVSRKGQLPDGLSVRPAAPTDRPEVDDPILGAFLNAPEDDEDLTAEDVAALEEGKADISRGALVPFADVVRRIGGGR